MRLREPDLASRHQPETGRCNQEGSKKMARSTKLYGRCTAVGGPPRCTAGGSPSVYGRSTAGVRQVGLHGLTYSRLGLGRVWPWTAKTVGARSGPNSVRRR